jgi:hypothetical protein
MKDPKVRPAAASIFEARFRLDVDSLHLGFSPPSLQECSLVHRDLSKTARSEPFGFTGFKFMFYDRRIWSEIIRDLERTGESKSAAFKER